MIIPAILDDLADAIAGEIDEEDSILYDVSTTKIEGNTITLVFDDGRRVRLTAELLP